MPTRAAVQTDGAAKSDSAQQSRAQKTLLLWYSRLSKCSYVVLTESDEGKDGCSSLFSMKTLFYPIKSEFSSSN